MSDNPEWAGSFHAIEGLPPSFRIALEEQRLPGETVRLLVYGPAFTTSVAGYPASVLAVLGRRWLVATEQPRGRVTVDACGYGDTLLLELTSVLLHGQLKIDFVRDGRAVSTAVQYNTVREKEYRRAIDLMLSGMEGEAVSPPPTADAPRSEDVLVADWPYKFHNLCPAYLPRGRRLRAALHWPTVYGGFSRELAPAAALLLTEREIVIFSEERSYAWLRKREDLKLGEVITYFPLSRLARFHIGGDDRLGVLGLEVHAQHGGESLDILFAPERTQAVTRLLEQATGGVAA